MTATREEVMARLTARARAATTDEEVKAATEAIRAFARRARAALWQPYPWQHPHVHPPGWRSTRALATADDPPGVGVCDERCYDLPAVQPGIHEVWLQRGGRGTGKTEGAAHYVNTHVEGPACDPRVPGGHRITIVAPTQADAVSSCVTGVTGLQAVNPAITVTTGRENTLVRFPNGAVGRLLGGNSSKDVDRARAWTNVCLWWVEEAAAIPHLGGLPDDGTATGVLDQAPFTLRLGDNPHLIVTTTPQDRPEVIHLINTATVQTWGRTQDADRLPAPIRESYETRFRHTTLGAQELDGRVVGSRPGALWVQTRHDTVEGEPNTDHRPGISNDRVPIESVGWVSHPRPEGLGGDNTPTPSPTASLIVPRVVIAVDPPGGRTECGIVVVGASGQHAYPLADLSLAAPPDTWARIVLEAYYDYGAEGLAVEHTYGGDMVPQVISSRAELLGVPAPPIFKVPTKVGKRLRAEPVQGLYQQHRVHHVGVLPGLEAEQRQWEPDESPDSPNRVDALVHGVTYLLIRAKPAQVSNPARVARSIPSTYRR